MKIDQIKKEINKTFSNTGDKKCLFSTLQVAGFLSEKPKTVALETALEDLGFKYTPSGDLKYWHCYFK